MELLDQLQQTLGDSYTLERELGGGGMARVFVAHERTLGRRIVIKTLGAAFGEAASAERFRREIRLVASLQQANIVPVHSAGEVDGVPYFTMPFVEGESLRTRLSVQGVLTIRETVSILRDVARALSFAHERGVVHRDIKPENVLLSGSTAVVTDFGVAKAIEASQSATNATNLTHIGMAVGTPAYMSPEQALGESTVDYRADIYALGILAYELLTGAPPFTAKNAQALILAHITQRPTPVAERCIDAPSELAALVMRCLEKDPDQRPKSAAEVLDLLDVAIASRTPTRVVAAQHTTPRAIPLVAVLPLDNMSASPDEEYFSDGITEDIIAQLARIASIRVISRTSVMRFKHADKGVKTIAAELGASHVVEGSVRRAGRRLRIVAQLIEAATDATLWAETYDRDLTDVFTIQSEVALSIAQALHATLTSGERQRIGGKPTESTEAYECFLLGTHHWYRFDVDGIRKAGEYFRRALELDPNFAAAHAGLANYYILNSGAPINGIPSAHAIPEAKRAAERALRLNSALGQEALALIKCWYEFDFDEALTRARVATEMEPNASLAWCARAHTHSVVGLHDEAMASSRRALELDPLSAMVLQLNAWTHTNARKFVDAQRYITRIFDLQPGFPLGHMLQAEIFLAQGLNAEALAIVEPMSQPMKSMDYGLGVLAMALGRNSRDAQAVAIADQLEQQSREGRASWASAALAHIGLGAQERALTCIEHVLDQRPPGSVLAAYIGVSPLFDSLRGEPRFAAVLKRLGLR